MASTLPKFDPVEWARKAALWSEEKLYEEATKQLEKYPKDWKYEKAKQIIEAWRPKKKEDKNVEKLS